MIKARKGPRRICQGDIFRDIEYIESITEKSGIIEISRITFPLVIVLTQDCDLAQDYTYRNPRSKKSNQDKWLLSILVAPLYNVEHIYSGVHLAELGMKMQTINSKRSEGEKLRKNQLPRFHFLDFPLSIPIVPSVIDFKHYFSLNVKYLHKIKKTNLICSVSSLYREDILQRFSSFLSRIGLPDNSLQE